MTRQLQHEDVNERIDAILRFGALWRFRWQVWPRLEDGAHMHIKVSEVDCMVTVTGLLLSLLVLGFMYV